MNKRVLVINGHPDSSPDRLCAALCESYAAACEKSGSSVRRINVGSLDFPLIRSADEFTADVKSPSIRDAQTDFLWAEHIVFVYPLWLGSQPALLKGFLEQVLRYGFALSAPGSGMIKGLLEGRTAHIMVTMGMPRLFYWGIFGAFATRAMERSMLRLCGIKPVSHTHFGGIGTGSTASDAVKMAAELGAQSR